MDAVEFLMNRTRFCENIKCRECEIYDECDRMFNGITRKDAEKMVNVVGQWAKEHPIKTRQSEFLKMFPDAKLSPNGILCIPSCEVDKHIIDKDRKCSSIKCDDCRRDYWMQEVE